MKAEGKRAVIEAPQFTQVTGGPTAMEVDDESESEG
jgi:hypothetical protein